MTKIDKIKKDINKKSLYEKYKKQVETIEQKIKEKQNEIRKLLKQKEAIEFKMEIEMEFEIKEQNESFLKPLALSDNELELLTLSDDEFNDYVEHQLCNI